MDIEFFEWVIFDLFELSPRESLGWFFAFDIIENIINVWNLDDFVWLLWTFLKLTSSDQSKHPIIQVSDQFLKRQVRVNETFEGEAVTRNIIDKDFNVSFIVERYSFVKILDLTSLHYDWDGSQFSTIFLGSFFWIEPDQSVELGRNINPILVGHLKKFNYFLVDFRWVQKYIAVGSLKIDSLF